MDLNAEKLARLARELLIEIGEDPAREGLLKTPERVAKALTFLTCFLPLIGRRAA